MRIFREKLIGCIVLTIAFLLAGCKAQNTATEDNLEKKDVVSEMTEYELLSDIDLAWKDNSLDDWQAIFNLPMEEIKEDGEQLSGTVKYFVCEKGAIRFKNHLAGSYKKNWSGVSGTSVQGSEFAEKIVLDTERVGMQIDLMGPIAGTEDYIAYWEERDENNEITGQEFYKLTESYEKKGEIKVQEKVEGSIVSIAADSKGNYHVLLREGGADGVTYIIISPKGDRIFSALGSFDKSLRILNDGRVVVCEEINKNNKVEGYRFLETDIEKGILNEFATLSLQKMIEETNTREYWPFYVTAKSVNELIWCGKEGLYLCNAQGEQTKLIYRWSNHGIVLESIKDVYAKKDGTIEVIYEDSDGVSYLLLQPTQEQTEIKSITFAVRSINKDAYLSAVSAFNKKYSTYNIELKDDYDETALLTQLGAGDGPVLIDSSLTGFDSLGKLWQPLDGYLHKTGLDLELLPQALDLGKIDGKTYGIVTNFFVRTLIVRDEKLLGWNYNRFLNAVEEFDGVIFTYDYSRERTDYRSTFFDILSNGLDDNFYINPEDDSLIFGSKEFERILKLSERAKKKSTSEVESELQNGRVLCEIYNVARVADLARLSTRLDNGDYVNGYPTINGAKYLITANNPIVVRATAAAEEKQMAYTFLKILLSYDSAIQPINNNSNTMFSVRKDVLEKQFDVYEREYSWSKSDDNIDEMEKPDKEKDRLLLEKILSNSAVQKAFPSGLKDIFDEEFGMYLENKISGALLEKHLKNRVGLYIEENK